MKKLFSILFMYFTLISFLGCNSINEIIPNKQITTQETSENATQEILEKGLKKTTDLIKYFEDAFPKAQIVSKTMADLDNDKEEDLVIIFNNPTGLIEITKSNICIVTNYSINALDLSGGTLNYQFAKDSESLKILRDPTRVSVLLKEVKTNKIFDFQVTMTTDKKEKLTNFKIESIEQSIK